MAWIKVEHETPDKPEIGFMAEILGISHEEVLGCLIRVWIWADQQTVGNNAKLITRTTIDLVSRQKGFSVALEKSGWLAGKEGEFSFPNYEQNNGSTAKTRALSQKRQSNSRSRKSNSEITHDALPLLFLSTLTLNLKYKEIDTPFFREKFEEWLEYRKTYPQKNLTPYSEQGLKSVLTRMANMGAAKAVASIDFSMSNMYQGIIETSDKGKTNDRRQTTGQDPGRGRL